MHQALPVKPIPKQQACLGIFSPSEPIAGFRVAAFEHGLKVLADRDYQVKEGSRCRSHAGYMAGLSQERIQDIDDLVTDPTVDALLASWGGKSCNQLIAGLNYNHIRSQRKAILGFSDVGVIANAVSALAGIVAFYGPINVGQVDSTEHLDLGILKKSEPIVNLLGDPSWVECQTLRKGIASGHLIGGNLSTFALGSIGIEALRDYWRGGIFIWEEIRKTPQLIDQHLTFLENAGFFKVISGMIIGDFYTEDEDESRRADPLAAVLRIVKRYDFPILFCPTFGHGSFQNPPLPIGAVCTLDADAAILQAEQIVVETI